MLTYEQIAEAVRSIRARVEPVAPQVGVILGSGLGALIGNLETSTDIPYQELPHFPHLSVPGHPGRLVLGRLSGVPVVVLQGRAHFYEGHTPEQVVFPTRVLCSLGIHTLIVTNSAGGINPSFAPGDMMIISDHLNLSGWNPLVGPNDERLGTRFPDMTAAYNPLLILRLLEVATLSQIPLQQGIYAGVLGPAYETPAEIRMLRTLGADAVGMSTVPEVVAAHHMGVKVVGLSCITNMAAGLGPRPLTHEDVAQTAARISSTLGRLLVSFIPQIAKSPLHKGKGQGEGR